MFDKASLKLGLDKAVLQNINAGKEKTDGSAAAVSINGIDFCDIWTGNG